MTALVIRAEARQLPLPDDSVDLIVTSPPYYTLRSYTDGGEHYAGQLGAEATPAQYIDALLDCTAEWVRVLKPSGSLFVNLGDKYGRSGGVDCKERGHANGDPGGRAAPRLRQSCPDGVPPKSLLMLPERYRIGAVDRLGLTARAVIVWSKPNGLPESVRDRVRRSHEDWVHLTKGPRYYSAVDEIREPVGRSVTGPNGGGTYRAQRDPGDKDTNLGTAQPNPLGKLPGSVWSIATEPLRVPAELGVAHFAAFPTTWPARLIAGWSPPGICTDCGEGRRPISTTQHVNAGGAVGRRTVGHITGNPQQRDGGEGARLALLSTVDAYVCACTPYSDLAGTGGQRIYHLYDWQPAPTTPAVVLDPLGGTGTTALCASVMGRVGISVDRSGDYCRLARWRTTDPTVRAKLRKKLGLPN